MRLPTCPWLILPALTLSTGAFAEVPRVVTDTAPVTSLVAMVMGELGDPAQLVPAGTSPHHAELRPADAAALADADLVIWTGVALVPRIGDAIASLAPGVATVELLGTDGWTPLAPRVGHSHGDHDLGAEDGGDHEEPGHKVGDLDPHAWLDPGVASAWVGSIEAALIAADPDNTATYAANAAAARDELSRLANEVAQLGAGVGGGGIAVGHDAYAYFERAAGLPPSMPLGLAEGGEPRAADAAALSDAAALGDLRCLVLDAETGDDWGETLRLRTVRADPDGVGLEPGAGLYLALIRDMVAAFGACLAP